jgi:hypothetical protein
MLRLSAADELCSPIALGKYGGRVCSASLIVGLEDIK